MSETRPGDLSRKPLTGTVLVRGVRKLNPKQNSYCAKERAGKILLLCKGTRGKNTLNHVSLVQSDISPWRFDRETDFPVIIGLIIGTDKHYRLPTISGPDPD